MAGPIPEGVLKRPTLRIRNFKSIKEQTIELAPLTVVYGPNGSGKSTALQALLTLRNLCLNPNQAVGAFFNYSFLNLGGFQAVVHDHNIKTQIEIGISWKGELWQLAYHATFGESMGRIALTLTEPTEATEHFELNVAFPYPLNQVAKREIKRPEGTFNVSWNGSTASAQVATPGDAATARANQFLEAANTVTTAIKSIAVAPPTRLFTDPQYSATSVSPWAVKQEEVATLLSNEKYLVHKVSYYLEKVVKRDLRVNSKPGAAFFTLDVTDRDTGIGTELVNDGAGVNQVAYMLTKALSQETERLCVEEPEIHLHPTAVRQLARVLCQLSKDENKTFMISTHSEPLLLAMLSLVRTGEIEPTDLAVYLVQKRRRESEFTRQDTNKDGQIAGGLRTLVEGELEDIKAFLESPRDVARDVTSPRDEQKH